MNARLVRLAAPLVLFAPVLAVLGAGCAAPPQEDEQVAAAEQADVLWTPPPGHALLDSECVNQGNMTVHNAGNPYHVDGTCPTTPPYTIEDASVSCWDAKVRYFGYWCADFADGTHAWTIYFGCCPPSCNSYGITFETRYFAPWHSSLPNTNVASGVWNSLPTNVAGYGKVNLADTAGFNNQMSHPGYNTDIASLLTVPFTVHENEVGDWQFRLGPDYGYGGALMLDGTELDQYWDSYPPLDLHWGGDFSNCLTNPDLCLSGARTLAAGVHTMQALGFENGYDDAMRLEFKAPGREWEPFVADGALCGRAPRYSPCPYDDFDLPSTGNYLLCAHGTCDQGICL